MFIQSFKLFKQLFFFSYFKIIWCSNLQKKKKKEEEKLFFKKLFQIKCKSFQIIVGINVQILFFYKKLFQMDNILME